MILLTGLAGLIAGGRRRASPALLPWLTGVALLVIPATVLYDQRFVICAIPSLCIAAAARRPARSGGRRTTAGDAGNQTGCRILIARRVTDPERAVRDKLIALRYPADLDGQTEAAPCVSGAKYLAWHAAAVGVARPARSPAGEVGPPAAAPSTGQGVKITNAAQWCGQNGVWTGGRCRRLPGPIQAEAGWQPKSRLSWIACW